MKNPFFIICLILFVNGHLWCQYVESFDVANKGIILGPCSTNDPVSCISTDFSGVNWSITGNLSGIDSEGLKTNSGILLYEDVDEEVCWESPLLNISTAGVITFDVDFSIPSGSTWDNSTTPGSTDYMNVQYAVDEGSYQTISNINGCAGSPYTLSGAGCGGLAGPFSTTITSPSIIGSFLTIRVCVDLNASSDDGHLEQVAIANMNVSVPVSWSSVEVHKGERAPIITWSTEMEESTERFEIERLNQATNTFEKIGEVQAAGFSTETQAYEFEDQVYSSSQQLYYRIKQIDFNGVYDFSDIVSLRWEEKAKLIQLYPNPVSEQFTIQVSREILENVHSVKIYNMIGALETQLNYTPSRNGAPIHVGFLPAGMYYILLEDNQQQVMGAGIRFKKL